MSRPAIKIEISFGSYPFTDLTIGTWSDVSPYVLLDENVGGGPITIARGRQSELDRIEAGTCSFILRNGDGRFTPGDPGGPYGEVKLCRRVRVSAVWLGQTYPLYTGYTETWTPLGQSATWGIVRVECVDAFGLIARQKVTTSISAGAANTAISAILNAVSFPSNRYLTGIGTVAAVDYTNANALSTMQDIAAVEDGTFYVEDDGYITLHSRYYRLQVQSSPFRTFTDSSGAGSPYLSADITYDDKFLYNNVIVTSGTTGNQQVATDGWSILDYRQRDLDKGTLPIGDTDAIALAQWLLYHYNVPSRRVNAIVTSGDLDNTMWPDLCNRVMDERVRVRQYDGGGYVEKDGWITGIRHDISRDAWLTTWLLIPADSGSIFFVLDSPTSGVLDQNVLGY